MAAQVTNEEIAAKIGIATYTAILTAIVSILVAHTVTKIIEAQEEQ